MRLEPKEVDEGLRFELASGVIIWRPDGSFRKLSLSGSANGRVSIPETLFDATRDYASEHFGHSKKRKKRRPADFQPTLF